MPEIHVPLAHGVQEGIDSKLLPDGWLSRAENVRFRKDGRLGSRYGYDFISGSQGAMIAAGNFGAKRSVYVKNRTAATTPSLVYDRHDDGTYVVSGIASTTAGDARFSPSVVGVPRRASAARNLQYTPLASDIATASGRIFCVIHDAEYASTGDRGTALLVIDATTHAFLYAVSLGTGLRNPKLVVCGTTLVVVYANGNNVDYATTLTTATSGLLATGTLVTAAAGRAFAFDVANYGGNDFLLVYETSGINMRWSSVAVSAGTIGAITTKHDVVIANPVRPSIAREGSINANVVVVWAEGATFNTGNVHWLEDTFAGAAVTGKTTLDSSGLAVGFPVAGKGNANVTNTAKGFAWARSDQLMGTYTNATSTVKNIGLLAPFCRPFGGPNSSLLMWCSNYATTGQTTSLATYKLIDLTSVQVTIQGATCEAIACQHVAMPGAYMTTSATNQSLVENRRSCVSVTSVLTVPSATAFAICIPIQSTNGTWSADLIRIDSSPYADTLLPANINGQLLFSGARMQEFDGSSFYESGLMDGPEYVTAADAGAGSIGAGTFQYSVIFEWTDASGRRHRSPPSTPVSVTIAASHNVLVSCGYPYFSGRYTINGGTDLYPGIVLKVYRTLAGGSIFYFTRSLFTTAHSTYDGVVFSFTDSSTDAAIAVNEVLYTQGARGGLSGLLPNDEPPPCRFIWAGNNRLIMGGLEEASEVRWSKLVFPGEPVQFADDPAFIARIDGEVTGVACLDGTWFVGSRNSIFAFSGDGPDDSGAGGDFGDPRKLPADIGFYSQRSIVEIPQGLLFQGRSDRLYLLPRGASAPQWVGQNVRDTLALYPVVTSAKLIAEENVVIFSCMNTAGTDGVLIVYDTRIGEWTVDIPFNGASASSRAFHCIDIYNGKAVFDGQIAETSAYADDESGSENRAIVGTFVTGDQRPFGTLGHGRYRRFVLLSEYRSATTFTIEESVDGGVTWSTPASFTPSNSAGDTVKVEYDLPIVRGEAYRFRVISTPTSPGEGFVFNSITGEVYPDKGTPRLAAAYRA